MADPTGPTGLLIDGRLVDGAGEPLDVEDPALSGQACAAQGRVLVPSRTSPSETPAIRPPSSGR